MPRIESLTAALVFGAAAFICAVPEAVADTVDDCTPPPPGLVQDLYDWIGANSDYEVAAAKADPPEIIFCIEGEEVPYGAKTTMISPREMGIFDFEERRIYLVAPWRVEVPRDVGVLLHELVHDVQFLNRDWPCPGATEIEAYKLYEDWLAEQGVEIELNWLMIYMWARCPRDIHPD